MTPLMEFIIAIVTILISNGVLSGILYYSINRKLKLAEVDSKKTEVKDQEVEILRKLDDEWQELYHEAKSRIKTMALICQDLRAQNEQLVRQNNMLELEKQKLMWCKCVVNGCPNRKPPRDYEKVGE